MNEILTNPKSATTKNRLWTVLIVLLFIVLVAGTGVLMAGEYAKAIENVRVGDTVKSYNERTGEIENKRVLETFENTTTELTTVTTIDGQEIIATPGHKFFANNIRHISLRYLTDNLRYPTVMTVIIR